MKQRNKRQITEIKEKEVEFVYTKKKTHDKQYQHEVVFISELLRQLYREAEANTN